MTIFPHYPEPGDRCYTAAGAEASGSSNLSGGFVGVGLKGYPAGDMVGWTNDAANVGLVAAAGHRRWLLDPFATYLSYGQVEGYGVQKVVGFDREPDITPPVEVDYVAFPYETYLGVLMLSGRGGGLHNPVPWSFSVFEDKTNSLGNVRRYFDTATAVSVTRVSDGGRLPVSDLYTELGDFLSWQVADWEFDTLYEVEIDNVTMRGGETQSFSYQVYIDRAGLM